jgi:membrane-associated phospholipid phosphatase
MDSGSKRAPLLPPVDPTSLSAPNRGRAAFLAILATGLVLFLVLLPAESRASLWTGLIGQRALVVLLSVFAVLTISLIGSRGQLLDARVFALLNMRIYPTWLDRGMWIFTQLGTMVSAFVVAFALLLLRYRNLAAGVVLGTLTLWMLVETIKLLSYRDRPFRTIEQARVVGWREIGTSFPSGHTAQAFFLSTLLIQQFQPGIVWAAALYAVATLVGFTRIYVGAHYPRDVIAGVVLGSVWGLLAWLVSHGWLALVSS